MNKFNISNGRRSLYSLILLGLILNTSIFFNINNGLFTKKSMDPKNKRSKIERLKCIADKSLRDRLSLSDKLILEKLKELENYNNKSNRLSVKETICRLVLQLTSPYAFCSAVVIVSMLCIKNIITSGELTEIVELIVRAKEVGIASEKWGVVNGIIKLVYSVLPAVGR